MIWGVKMLVGEEEKVEEKLTREGLQRSEEKILINIWNTIGLESKFEVVSEIFDENLEQP